MAVIALAVCMSASYANHLDIDVVTDELIEMIDLNRPGLEQVKSASTARGKREALLEYFRQRQIPSLLNHSPDDLRGKPLSEKEQQWADGALKHYYIGQRDYPLQYRGEEIDWDSNPFADNEWLWQLHRFYWWRPMGKAYWSTGDERYAEQWVEEVKAWVNHMHAQENFEQHPGWRALETGIRLESWPATMEYFLHSPSLDADTFTLYLWSLQQHLPSMLRRYSGNPDTGNINNHYLHQLSGVLKYTLYFPEYKQGQTTAVDTIDRIVQAQQHLLLPDGVINEMVPSYHTGYPGQFLESVALSEKYGLDTDFPQGYYDSIEKAIDAVMIWSHPDGTYPQFGDAWAKSPGTAQRFVGRFTDDFDRPDWDYYASDGQEGIEPTGRLHSLPDAGYYTMRSGWSDDALFLVIKNSHIDRKRFAHNQLDNMSFELSAYGEKLMIDSGCYSYFGTPEWRAWFRQPYAHQMVTLNDELPASKGEMLLQVEGEGMDVTSLINHPYPGLVHRRTFLLVDGKYILILDELSGEAGGVLSQHFQFMPGNALFDSGSLRARTLNKDGANLVVETLQSDLMDIQLRQTEGWVSTVYMEKQMRPAFAYDQEKLPGENAYFLTALIPLPENRQLWDLRFGFLENGYHSTAMTDQIYLGINNSEKYVINLDFDSGQFSATKKSSELSEQALHDAYYDKEKQVMGHD